MIEKKEFIRINSSFNAKVTSYIVKNIDIPSIVQQPNISTVAEGIYFSEIFVSKGFYKYYEILDEDNDIVPATRVYLWDYRPFSELTIINPLIYKKMNLTISEDKMCYYYKDKLICKNTIKETGNDELLIENKFLKDFLSENMYSIVWVFAEDTESLENKNIIVQYDGKKVSII